MGIGGVGLEALFYSIKLGRRGRWRLARLRRAGEFPDMPDSNAARPFSVRLREIVTEVGAPLCVGLDPGPELMPAAFASAHADGAAAFCLEIIDATAPHAAAYKPNLAFFESYGTDGWRAFPDVCRAIRESGRLLVLDGKRGDIGNTGRRYAAAAFDRYDADAATVAPYMGSDSVSPFLEPSGTCAFVLVATSNPGGADLQSLVVDGEPLYKHTARMAVRAGAGQPGEVGFVVGATRPELLADLRAEHPDVPFLVPGVGAQGGSPAEVMAANAGGPILVNSSRSILYAASGSDFPQAATAAAARLAEALGG